ncbi:MAG: LacI family DNA-binding transcriptional regulator [Dorea sp.]|nr:LacI family DNA-binding transcriptional regulator [Dorea sp.]
MATIKDVAKRAGVGIATVSRALNGTGYLSEESRTRIERAVKELNYIPNERARNLSRKRTGIIGVLIPDFQTPFYDAFIRQVEIGLYNYGYRTMVCNCVKTRDKEKEFIDMLERNMVDGLITCALSLEDSAYRYIQKPIVSMDHDLGVDIPLIYSNHRIGGRMAAEYLISQGCRKVLQLGGRFETDTPSNERYEEFARVMSDNHAAVQILDLEWNRLDYEYYQCHLGRHQKDIREADGVFASDMGAIGMYHFASELGIRIPEELKIVAYDGTAITRMVTPVVTAVCQDISLLAQKCTDTMIQLVRGEDEIEDRQVVDVYFQKGGTA